jgi:hypothetical protein
MQCPRLNVHLELSSKSFVFSPKANEQVINVEHGRRLADAATQCEYREMVGAGHNDMEHVAWNDMAAHVSQLIHRLCLEARQADGATSGH